MLTLSLITKIVFGSGVIISVLINELTDKQKAVLVVDGLQNLGSSRFIMRSDLDVFCEQWKRDPKVRQHKNTVMALKNLEIKEQLKCNAELPQIC